MHSVSTLNTQIANDGLPYLLQTIHEGNGIDILLQIHRLRNQPVLIPSYEYDMLKPGSECATCRDWSSYLTHLFDRIFDKVPSDFHWPCLTHPVNSIDCLFFSHGTPLRLKQVNAGSCCKVESRPYISL